MEEMSERTSIILVHGIGDFEPGSSLQPLIKEGKSQIQQLSLGGLYQREAKDKAINIQSQSLEINDRTVNVVEFHWSGAAGKINRLNIFKSFWLVFSMLLNLPRLGAWSSKSTFQHRFADLTGLWLVLSAIAFTVMSVWYLSYEFLGVFEIDENTASSWFYTTMVVCLLPYYASLAAIPLLFIRHRRITPWCAQWIGVFVGYALAFLYGIFVITAITIGFATFDETTWIDHETPALGWQEWLLALFVMVLIMYAFFKLTAFITDLIRDVVHYLAVDKNGNAHADTIKIKADLHQLIDEEVTQGATRVIIVSHSLGTAITAEVLRERNAEHIHQNPFGTLQLDLVTCGSPLRRALHRLLPDRVPSPKNMFLELKQHSEFNFGRWINCYRILDPVGQRLSGYWFRTSKPGEGIEDYRIKPSYKKPYGHSDYWGDKRFLRILISNLMTP